MKTFLFRSLAVLGAFALTAGPSLAGGAFGLFTCGGKCCDSFCVRPYNAFSPVAFGNITIGCGSGCASCGHVGGHGGGHFGHFGHPKCGPAGCGEVAMTDGYMNLGAYAWGLAQPGAAAPGGEQAAQQTQQGRQQQPAARQGQGQGYGYGYPYGYGYGYGVQPVGYGYGYAYPYPYGYGYGYGYPAGYNPYAAWGAYGYGR